VAAAALTVVLNVVLNLLLIPRFAVAGTMVATAVAFACGLAYRYTALQRLQRRADVG
jgi:O-antigen/teichoic acid export membrane protein